MSLKGSIKINIEDTIAVFSYAFPHRKTFDFLQLIRSRGFTRVIVFGAPRKNLDHQDGLCYFNKFEGKAVVEDTEKVCERLGFEYVSCEHDDVELINRLVCSNKIKFSVISGARIIKPNIIDLFSDGILNIHPGKLPETAGLDALYYTIRNNLVAGVTVHTINHKVDEGCFIFFKEYEYSGTETLGGINESLYLCQLTGLVEFFDKALNEGADLKQIHRPFKNQPMQPEEKLIVLSRYGKWRSIQLYKQILRKILTVCEFGSVSEYFEIDSFSNYINIELQNGWTPLIVASYNQNFDLVNYLIEKGADVNYKTAKGTTVLMYAKTKLVNKDYANYELLSKIVAAGADKHACDVFGKTIFDYVKKDGDYKLLDFLEKV